MLKVTMISVAIALCLFFGEILEKSSFPPILAPSPIPATEPIPDFNKIAVETLARANEKKSTPPWEFLRSSLPEDEQNFWTFLRPLGYRLITTLISLMIHYFAYCKYRGGWQREDEAKQKLSHLRMLVQECDSSMLELTTTLALVKDAEDHRHAQFQNVMDSVRKMTNVNDKIYVEFHKDMYSKKQLMKVEDERRAQFLSAVELMKSTLNREKIRRAKFRNEMDSVKMKMERTPSMPMIQADGTRRSIQVPLEQDAGQDQHTEETGIAQPEETAVAGQQPS
jgi:hypothetical protein